VTPLAKLDVDDVYVAAVAREAWLQSGRRSQVDPITQIGTKRLSALFQLEYWKGRNFVNMDHVHIISFWVYCKRGSIVTNWWDWYVVGV
jgi:hypothetical protein